MSGLFHEFLDPTGEPCQGTVTLTPKRALSARLVIQLDKDGEFDEDVAAGDYRVDIRLRNADTITREISVPEGDSVDLATVMEGYEPAPSEATTVILAAGPFVYQIPFWATHIDRIHIGGGGGGDDGTSLASGDGGGAGSWIADTLIRGTDIPWDSTTITGTVGAGGVHDGGRGGNTSSSAVGAPILTAPGGVGGANTGSSTGLAAGSVTYNDIVYQGGAAQATKGTVGNSPGGGGAGGNSGSQDAGAGAAGGVWLRAYRES